MSDECVKLTVGFLIIIYIGNVVRVHILEASTWDVGNSKECFKNKIISLVRNTDSTT